MHAYTQLTYAQWKTNTCASSDLHKTPSSKEPLPSSSIHFLPDVRLQCWTRASEMRSAKMTNNKRVIHHPMAAVPTFVGFHPITNRAFHQEAARACTMATEALSPAGGVRQREVNASVCPFHTTGTGPETCAMFTSCHGDLLWSGLPSSGLLCPSGFLFPL